MSQGAELERRGDVSAGRPELPHAPALDGLRTFAVLSVMAFHNFSWLPGGFYGVDAFFVLSGFLITSLLVVEWRGSGTVRLGRFWARRARRLLPALFVLVGGLGVLFLVWPSALPWPDPLPDAAATLGYVANWHFVVQNSSYFAASAPPSPLLHTWSLAIEEQFYLVWPLVVLVVLGGLTRIRRGAYEASRHRRLMLLGVLSAAGALASAAWMWVLVPPGASPNRAYYGTDARAQALLVGATLAVGFALWRTRRARARRAAGLVSIAGTIAAAFIWHYVPETSTLAFHGGFLLASLASAAVVGGVVVAPAGPVACLVSLRPIRYLGRISYGAYLWYWPVTLVVTAARTGTSGWMLFLARTTLTFALAALSFHFVELPIRRGNLPGWRQLAGVPAAVGLSLTLIAVGTASASPAPGTVPAHNVAETLVSKAAGPPVRVLIVGDSMAGSLGASLAPEAGTYGVQLINEGRPGCSASTDSEYQFLLYVQPPGSPCRIGDPSALLDSWREWVETYKPSVVVYLAQADLFDQDHGGTWTWLGNRTFDRFLQAQLEKATTIFGSLGARVVLLTSPYYSSAGSQTLPEDQPGRVTADDQILRAVSAWDRNVVLYPFANVVDPHGHYTGVVDGVNMRCADDIHFSDTAGRVIAPHLLPALVRLGRSAHPPVAGDPPPLPSLVPRWYGKLSCGS